MYSDKKNILQLVALLKAHGVRKIVLCPGSRNAAIVHTLANIEDFTCYSVTDERNAEWLKLEKKYRPWIDFDNLPFYGRGAGWQRQLHIYECPFYYIDYCLSTMAALQFFLLSLDDHKDAWERYLRLVRRAGMASYTELLETAGLKVPFEEGSIKGIAQQMTDWLETHQV